MSSDERCAFCERARGEVRKMVHGTKAAICSECIDLCWDILSEPSAKRGGQAIAQERAMALAGRKYKDAFAGVDADQLESFVADAVQVARDPPVRALRTVRFWLSHAGPSDERARMARVQDVVDEALGDEPARVNPAARPDEPG